MNKPQYLAELGQLLVFMTRADREKTLARYGALFDAAGPGGQDAVLAKLGSTTRQAIRLSRIYDAEGYEDEFLDEAAAELEAEPSPESEDVSEPEAAPEPISEAAHLVSLIEEDLPDFELPDLPDLPGLDAKSAEPAPASESAPEPETEPAAEQSPAPEPETAQAGGEAEPSPTAAEEGSPGGASSGEQPDESAKDVETGEADAEYEELWGKRPAPARKQASAASKDEAEPEKEEEQTLSEPTPSVYTTVERVIPLWAGVPLFVLTVVFIVLPLTVLCVALIPALLIPGLAVLLGAWLAFVGGLWCVSIIADAAVLFGSALILLALGLIILWCGLWLDVAMVSGFVRALRGLAHLTLGRKVTVHA